MVSDEESTLGGSHSRFFDGHRSTLLPNLCLWRALWASAFSWFEADMCLKPGKLTRRVFSEDYRNELIPGSGTAQPVKEMQILAVRLGPGRLLFRLDNIHTLVPEIPAAQSSGMRGSSFRRDREVSLGSLTESCPSGQEEQPVMIT